MRYSETQMCQKCHHKYNVTHKEIIIGVVSCDSFLTNTTEIFCYECDKACDRKVINVSIS